MSYSSALFTKDDQTLEDAQTEKQRRAIALLDVRGGEACSKSAAAGAGWRSNWYAAPDAR